MLVLALLEDNYFGNGTQGTPVNRRHLSDRINQGTCNTGSWPSNFNFVPKVSARYLRKIFFPPHQDGQIKLPPWIYSETSAIFCFWLLIEPSCICLKNNLQGAPSSVSCPSESWEAISCQKWEQLSVSWCKCEITTSSHPLCSLSLSPSFLPYFISHGGTMRAYNLLSNYQDWATFPDLALAFSFPVLLSLNIFFLLLLFLCCTLLSNLSSP